MAQDIKIVATKLKMKMLTKTRRKKKTLMMARGG